MLIIVSIYICM